MFGMESLFMASQRRRQTGRGWLTSRCRVTGQPIVGILPGYLLTRTQETERRLPAMVVVCSRLCYSSLCSNGKLSLPTSFAIPSFPGGPALRAQAKKKL